MGALGLCHVNPGREQGLPSHVGGGAETLYAGPCTLGLQVGGHGVESHGI